MIRSGLTGAVAVLTLGAVLTSPGAAASPTADELRPVGHRTAKSPVMTGGGGAVASVDPVASQVGIDILSRGGNAADAAVATAAAVAAVEPYSSGIGGGGFFVYYDAATRKVSTIDGRESAPASFTVDSLTKPDGTAMDFSTVVNSGLSVGVPGSPAQWELAAEKFGTMSMTRLLQPAENIAGRGFVVDQTFYDDTAANAERFAMFPETAKIYLPGGKPVPVGKVQRNPDLAKAYRELRTKGAKSFYRGQIGRDLVLEVQSPTTAPGVKVPSGQLTVEDLTAYKALIKAPTRSEYRGLDVYGMDTPSSGGIAVSQILNLLEAYEDRTGRKVADLSEAEYLHWFSEASATAFADRNRHVGDVVGVPTAELTSQEFADERACLFDPKRAQARPIPWGEPDGEYTSCARGGKSRPQSEGQSTTSLTVTDKWGNVVTFTQTIEQYGGSGIVVPGWGFLLNNEITDFNFTATSSRDPNLPGPSKRPRSSMAPTIILKDGVPLMTAGSPGGATIITTVAQIITGHIDRGLSIGDAVAAARLSSRNGPEEVEAAIFDGPVGAQLRARGHRLRLREVIGNGSAIRTISPGWWTAAAEPVRRGGGSAMVVNPAPKPPARP